MRGWSASLGLALVVFALPGCRARDGESWARDTLGEAGAEAIRREAGSFDGLPTGAETPRYLPRPFVILSTGSSGLVYDAMNRRLTPAVKSADEVRGVVVLDKDIVNQRVGRRNVGHAEYQIRLVDRAAKTSTTTHIESFDALESFLSSVPAGP